MARPRLNQEEKLESLKARLVRNTRFAGPDECWAHEGPYYYTIPPKQRLRPRSVAWVVYFPERGLPEPPHLRYIGNLDSCSVEECVNPDHLEVKTNVKKEVPRTTIRGKILRQPAPEGAHWNPEPGKGLELIWESIEAWKKYHREVKGYDDEWIARRSGVMAEVIANQTE